MDTTWKGETHDLEQAIALMKARPDFRQTVQRTKTALYGNTGIAWGMTEASNASGQVLVRIAFTDVFRYDQVDRRHGAGKADHARKAALSGWCVNEHY